MIAIPITAPTIRESAEDIKSVCAADIIELRLDLIEDISVNGLEELLSTVVNRVIVTDRDERRHLLEKAVELGVDFIDMDISMGEGLIKEIAGDMGKTEMIVSFHDFEKTDERLLGSMYDKIKELDPHTIKLASFANDITDNRVMFDIIARAKDENRRIIALCMGEKGIISRILSPLFGSELTFASLTEGKESAPGQITAEKLRDIYRLDDLSCPRIFGLVGNPVGHSRGIIIHNRAFAKLGLQDIYVNFLVDDLGKFMDKYRDMISGLSVTIPFKREIMKYLDEIEPYAGKIGAVNTVLRKGTRLIGCNTDMPGAIDAIKDKLDIKNKNVALIGAGGVARAIAFGIINEKGNLTIINRTVEKARKLADELGCGYAGLDRIEGLRDIDLLINATSIGMHPEVGRTPVQKEILEKITAANCVVFDSVYNPARTSLLADAAGLGLQTVSGEKMFMNQAARQFRLFTEREMQ